MQNINWSVKVVLEAKGGGNMREPLEMLTVSRMQNMVQNRKKAPLFRDRFFFVSLLLGHSASRAPAEGPFCN